MLRALNALLEALMFGSAFRHPALIATLLLIVLPAQSYADSSPPDTHSEASLLKAYKAQNADRPARGYQPRGCGFDMNRNGISVSPTIAGCATAALRTRISTVWMRI